MHSVSYKVFNELWVACGSLRFLDVAFEEKKLKNPTLQKLF